MTFIELLNTTNHSKTFSYIYEKEKSDGMDNVKKFNQLCSAYQKTVDELLSKIPQPCTEYYINVYNAVDWMHEHLADGGAM